MTSLFRVAVEQANAKRERRILLPVPGSGSVDLLLRSATAEDVARSQKIGKRLFPKDDMLAAHQSNLALLAACCVEVWQDGVPAATDDGDVVTFSSRETLTDLGVATANEAVAKIVGRDGDVNALASAVLLESGFNPDGTPLDATENPTTTATS